MDYLQTSLSALDAVDSAALLAKSAGSLYKLPETYGSALGGQYSVQRKDSARGQRQLLNIATVFSCLFAPWFLFCWMYWTMSFSLHYKSSGICWLFALLGLVAALLPGFSAINAFLRRKVGSDASYQEPMWSVFLFGSCLTAWALGLLAGDANFFHHMEPYYDMSNLNTYPNIDPSRLVLGQTLMDAGRVTFSPGTKLDVSKSMGFKSVDHYCVAPIVAGNNTVRGNETKCTNRRRCHYDFWAVGMNCCSGNRADFACGEYNNVNANAGLRVMRKDERTFFRLAVQKAEAAYNLTATHPLFFYWMTDPSAEVAAWIDEGYKYFLAGIFGYFVFQLLLVVFACLAFSKMGLRA